MLTIENKLVEMYVKFNSLQLQFSNFEGNLNDTVAELLSSSGDAQVVHYVIHIMKKRYFTQVPPEVLQ